ncbi:DUF4336 domain-containing protein [Nostoc sp. FACHB-110]|uniref:DUF4336 domain-containing protein n=1 Tax=Nostoc sp. FACHB-110 TaxID=2692834 RepID=UPI0016891AED|nr:DUF4336 domain-containing protein [Nostoc sp. FACHB-110]MBD2438412.1 DUF4336 domain-containing protein [Nostoc sp. FACHB-110]
MYSSTNPQDWSWPFWPVVPLYPYKSRRTLCQEIVKNTIWTFDQMHGILYTIVPIRMTVIKLTGGGLLVYAPVAPTAECVRMVKELVAQHGEVKYIILPTSSGLEHKVFVGPFARCFPQAQVFVAPHQWSFPFNLPLSWLGFPQARTQELPENSRLAPFAEDFEYEVLDINLGRGSFVEVAFFHKRSHTLLLTDTILSITPDPPPIFQLDPYPLLFHARENALQPIADTEATRRQGWQRICLFAIYFRPSTLQVTGLKESFSDAFKAPDHSRKAYFGLYPFRWQQNWQDSFATLSGYGRPFVAPILQTLILPQGPTQTLDWADKVAHWDFHQIIPCHFDAPISVTPYQFRQAFSFLEKQPSASRNTQTLLEADCKFIQELEAYLLKRGIATPPKEKV